jgi:hypothetical protein
VIEQEIGSKLIHVKIRRIRRRKKSFLQRRIKKHLRRLI